MTGHCPGCQCAGRHARCVICKTERPLPDMRPLGTGSYVCTRTDRCYADALDAHTARAIAAIQGDTS